ncbi:MAG: Na+/H+ antiporter NhaC family protein [Bacteroidales bacterium]
MEDFAWLSLIPALVTIVFALTTKRVALSLFLGIVAGAFTYHHGKLLESARGLFNYLLDAFTDPERISIVVFILLIGSLLEIIAKSGGYEAFAKKLEKRLHNGRKSRLTTWGISMLLFFDDYANVLISGASMRNINLKNGVSPAMLAYIVDVVAIMASIMIISTWAAFEGSVMVDAATTIGREGSLSLFFLESLPYHFYTFLAITLALVVAYSGKWFGYKLDNQPIPDTQPQAASPKGKAKYVIVPVLTLIGFALVALFVSGTWILTQRGEPLTLISILGEAPSVEILIIATLLAILVLILLLQKEKALSSRQTAIGMLKGGKGMVDVSLVIFMATGLAAVSSDLETGRYISDSLSGYITPQILPAVIFIIAMLITVATGFSWSSMAIVMPIAYQMAIMEGVPDLIPVISAAVISGAVSGEHMIPYSEKCVMTSAACKISPVYHIKTHILQTLTVFSAGIISFLLIGHRQPLWLAFLAGLAFILFMHKAFARKPVMKTE